MENEPLLPPGETAPPPAQPAAPVVGALSGAPSPKAQSLGAVISIIIIVLMVVVGAFYAWGKRVAQEQALTASSVPQ